MIGEMRDKETAHSAVEASLTGHLVLSTLHTNSAPETIVRLLDLGLDPVSFADALKGVLAQRLVRTLCKNCKKNRPIEEAEVEAVKHFYGEEAFPELGVVAGETEIAEGHGCEKCGGTGYRGRTGIHELLVSGDEIRALIYESATAADIRDVAKTLGMRTLMQDGIRKMLAGQTDLQQIRAVAAA
jgi:type II secretory ATPase GspE/PulE/Tfp pilus assembly ATPase PilB-like protein